MQKILVTGGAGYIGSHTVIELVQAGYKPVVVDNFSNSSPESTKRVSKILSQEIDIIKVDLCNKEALKKVFETHKFSAVIHFAGFKAVGESVAKPLEYYHNNLVSTLNLCALMDEFSIQQMVFSSSATVYGDPEEIPITEQSPIRSTNPYGQTKVMIEQILKDWAAANPELEITCLRYFNPVGAHGSGLIGEGPNGIPNNLLPFVAQVAVGKLETVSVFGNDYDTPDGTGVRDYIHVCDLAKGHVAALKHSSDKKGWRAINLGTGKGNSVPEAIQAFEDASGKKIPYQIVPRRPGDIATCYADTTKAKEELKWAASKTFADACKDAWNWQSRNPNGYK